MYSPLLVLQDEPASTLLLYRNRINCFPDHSTLDHLSFTQTHTLTPSKIVCKYYTETNRNWWTYPFLPYVDLWLEAFHRVEHLDHARRLGYTATSGGGDAAGTGKKEKRPRWNGVAAQVVWGLAPLAMVAIVWRVSGDLFLGSKKGGRRERDQGRRGRRLLVLGPSTKGRVGHYYVLLP